MVGSMWLGNASCSDNDNICHTQDSYFSGFLVFGEVRE